jgi:hypothetical protein
MRLEVVHGLPRHPTQPFARADGLGGAFESCSALVCSGGRGTILDYPPQLSGRIHGGTLEAA